KSGDKGLVTLKQKEGKPIPFGAVISYSKDTENMAGIVGEDGIAYVSGLSAEGEFNVKWGYSKDQSCIAKYQLPAKKSASGLYQIAATCL
ncbi:fimbrial biogenesis outer membrane usher protein, partial [Shigella flexneri]|nr:fimbrial biogenesis outer membrane usher protein [Shigella flexneri]